LSATDQPYLEPVTSLTLDEAIRLALEHSPTVAAARREIEATEGQILQGSLRPNPDIAYAAEDMRHASRSSTAQLDIPIETAGKREARIEAAQRGRIVAVSDLGSAQLRLRAAVTAAFFDVLAAQELTALAKQTVLLAQRATDIASKRVTAGKVSPVEETRARVAEAGVRVSLLQAESQLRNARHRLSGLWGNPEPRFTEVSGELDRLMASPDLEVVQRRLAASPLLERAQRELERRRSLVSLEQRRAVPDVSFSLGMKRQETLSGDQVLVGVKVPLPVFNRNQGNLLEALRREDKAREELRAVRVSLSSEALQALERVGARRDEVELLRRDLVPGAQSAYEAATIGFENGKFSFLEVLDAQRTYFSAKSQYLTALAAFHRAQTELESLLGQVSADPVTSSSRE
jgi:cobalt-zinc-cadmium efflux system outer membrane protein